MIMKIKKFHYISVLGDSTNQEIIMIPRRDIVSGGEQYNNYMEAEYGNKADQKTK